MVAKAHLASQTFYQTSCVLSPVTQLATANGERFIFGSPNSKFELYGERFIFGFDLKNDDIFLVLRPDIQGTLL